MTSFTTHSSEAWPSVSITVPTYKEVRNVPLLVERLKKVRDDHQLEMEVVIVDDNSRDGTTEAVAAMGLPWVRLIVREPQFGGDPRPA
jgi:dolichol-phosphate mannosyltransferase